MKQTAVEWLHEELLKILIDNQIQQTDYLFDQAKAMEKEQIIKFAEAFATSDAIYCSGEFALEKDAEHYYNETYGGEDARLD
jgi:hypothetical protein